VRLFERDMEVGNHGARVSRRAALGQAGAAAVAAAAVSAVGVESARAAAGSAPFIVVDPAGGGDYTDVEQAVKNAPAGAFVYVLPGTFVVQLGDMDPKAGVHISGAGYGTVLRARSGLNTNVFSISRDYVTVEHLRIDGNAAAQSAASNGIYFTGQHGQILNCFVHDARGYNIVGFAPASHWIIEGNHSYATGVSAAYPSEGIELHGPSRCSIVGNTVIGARNNGILLWNANGDCHHNTVVGNTVRDCGVSGIELEDGAHDNTITGNTCENNHWGIWINENGSSGPPRANTVTANTVTKSLQHGIMLIGITEGSVSGNAVAENLAHGIRLVRVRAVTVTGNSTTRNLRAGISLEDSSDCVVSANVCANNGRDRDYGALRTGIAVQQGSGTTQGNIISDNRCVDTQSPKTQSYGVALIGTPTGNLIGPNVLTGNATSGWLIPSAAAGQNDSVPFHKVKATVGTAETAVPHGLPFVPQSVTVLKTSPGDIWQSSAPDATNVYLRADAAGRTVEILAG
jgi:parallel beta-helix repeat protein